MSRNEFDVWESEGNNILDATDEGADKKIAGQLSESNYNDGNFLIEGVQPTTTSDVMSNCVVVIQTCKMDGNNASDCCELWENVLIS